MPQLMRQKRPLPATLTVLLLTWLLGFLVFSGAIFSHHMGVAYLNNSLERPLQAFFLWLTTYSRGPLITLFLYAGLLLLADAFLPERSRFRDFHFSLPLGFLSGMGIWLAEAVPVYLREPELFTWHNWLPYLIGNLIYGITGVAMVFTYLTLANRWENRRREREITGG